MIHLLLVIFTACQAILIISEHNKYSRSQERLFYNMFIDDSDKRTVDYPRSVYLYSVEEIKTHLATSVSNFYNVNTRSLEIVEHVEPKPFSVMEFTYIDNHLTKNKEPQTNSNTIEKKFEYRVDQSTLGPFDNSNEEVKRFLNDVVEFRMNYTLKTYVPYYYNNNYDCSFWTVTQFYKFVSRAHFVTSINILRYSCDDIRAGHNLLDLFVNKLLWVHLLVFFLSITSVILSWHSISTIANMYMKAKEKAKTVKF